jgi:hypothetical protein
MTRAMQYEKPQLKRKSLKELRELIKLRLPGQYTDEQLKEINGKNKSQAIDYFLQKIRQDEEQDELGEPEGEEEEEEYDDRRYALAPDHPNFRMHQQNDDHFGLDSSIFHSNSKFDDRNYDRNDDDDDDDNDDSLPYIKQPLGTVLSTPNKVFTSPKKVFKDQAPSSTTMTLNKPENKPENDDNNSAPPSPFMDLFYSSNKGLGIGLQPVSAKKVRNMTKSREDKLEDKQILRAVIKEEKKQANRAKRASLIPAPIPIVESGGGGTVRVVSSKPRGRPVGSKNKPKGDP